jgi:hypothetical protein
MNRKFAELGLDENVLTDLKQVFQPNKRYGKTKSEEWE